MSYDDDTLMAYADGELDETQRAEIAAALERDPALASRVAQHRALRAQVAGAFSTLLAQPVPERLVAAAKGTDANRSVPAGSVLQFPARTARAPAPSWSLREWGAMAASLVFGAVISWKLFAPSDSALIAAHGGSLVARGSLASALDDQLASSQRGDEPVLIGLSFQALDAHYCRSFTLSRAATAGLACRVAGEWQIPVTAAAQAATGGVRQAASPPPAVLQAIEMRIAGEALDAAGEEKARSAGWNRPSGQR